MDNGRQGDLLALLDPPPPPPEPWEADRDEGEQMLDQVVKAGLADGYSVGLGYHPRVRSDIVLDGIWATPSRLMEFPYRFRLADGELPNRIVARHPLLIDHPQIIAVAKFTGWPVVEPIGSDGWGEHGVWHHAVDLIAAGLWRTLLETRQFTTDDCIAGGVCYGLDYGPHLITDDARALLAAIDADEPDDRSLSIFRRTKFAESDDGKKQRTTAWPLGTDHTERAWARVHGIEDGILKMDRSGFLTWTDKAPETQIGTPHDQ